MNVAVLGTLARGAGAVATDTLFSPYFLTGNSQPPYTVSASGEHYDGYVWYASRAFSGSDDWWMPSATIGWLKLDLGSDITATLYTYKVSVNTIPEPNRAPKAWTVQGSNNDSDWTTLDTVTGQTSWSSGEEREFTCDVTTTAYRYFKIDITENNGDANHVQVAELKLYGISTLQYPRRYMTSNTAPGGTASASTEANSLNAAHDAFDGSTSTKWTAKTTTGWLAYENMDTMTIKRYTVTGPVSGEETYAPKDWTLEGYDGEDWVTLDTQTGQTSWSALEVRAFNLSAMASYTKIRINITANDGGDLVSIVEFRMYSDAA